MSARDGWRCVLLTWGERKPEPGTWEKIEAHRWAASFGWWPVAMVPGVFLGVDQENRVDGAWGAHGCYFTLSITPAIRWGARHDYYDGPHCSFSVGPLHFSWSYWWCSKCMPLA